VRRITLRVSLAVLGLLLVAASADAQRRRPRFNLGGDRPRFGGHIGYAFDGVDKVLLGAQASFPVVPRLSFYPSFDYYFVDVGSRWGLNFDLKFRPPTPYGFWYVGGGLNILHASAGGVGGTNTNLNLFTGLEGRRGPIRPFAEARLIVGDGSLFQIGGGLSLTL